MKIEEMRIGQLVKIRSDCPYYDEKDETLMIVELTIATAHGESISVRSSDGDIYDGFAANDLIPVDKT